MNPLRIVILGILFYVLYRLLFGTKKVTRSGPASSDGKKSGREVAQDILVEDPECHTYIPKGQAIALKSKGQTYYFCSSRCRDAFAAKSEKGD